MSHRIGVIGGDGIGPEVTAEALKVLDATGVAYERVDYDLGAHRYLEDGTVLPDEVLEEWRGLDAILLGAVGDPAPGVSAPAGLVERGILLRMRFELDQYINLRPFRVGGKVDFEVIRENTEGTYAGEGGFLRKNTPHEIATQGRSTRAWESSGACVSLSTRPLAPNANI
ncbi:MAG: isocitrate/isopropylmalate family dehydrogenase [Microthrixaceae bacterium]